MMDWTDRHCRFFLRGFAPDTLLYTEMITTGAILRGDREKLLRFDPEEHPLALQVGGSDPAHLAEAARIGAAMGYDEINLNCGCPSDRVHSGAFGACLMLKPRLVAECVAAMRDAVTDPGDRETAHRRGGRERAGRGRVATGNGPRRGRPLRTGRACGARGIRRRHRRGRLRRGHRARAQGGARRLVAGGQSRDSAAALRRGAPDQGSSCPRAGGAERRPAHAGAGS